MTTEQIFDIAMQAMPLNDMDAATQGHVYGVLSLALMLQEAAHNEQLRLADEELQDARRRWDAESQKMQSALADAHRLIDELKSSAKQSASPTPKAKRNRYHYSESEAIEIRAEIIRNIEHMIAVGIPNTITKYNETFHPYPTVKVRFDRIGVTWNELVIAAGGTPNFSGKQYSAMRASKNLA